MNFNLIFLIKLSIVGGGILFLNQSCSKDSVTMESHNKTVINLENKTEVVKFFAYALNVSEREIKYDSLSQELFIPNTIVREKYSRVEKEYNNANIYKAQNNIK